MASWSRKGPYNIAGTWEFSKSCSPGLASRSVSLSGSPAFSVDPLYENQREP